MSSNKLVKKIRYTLRFMPDKIYIQLNYFAHFGKPCNFKDPKTFNEKINWLKLNDHDPLYTKLVDKYEGKEYIKKRIGDEYIIPTLGVYDRFDEIDFEKLPDQFVLKCTHDSEGIVIVKDKSKFDIKAARKKINSAMKQNFYYIGREWPYKNVKPRIIAEQYMTDESGVELKDYKIFCFNGKPEYVEVDFNRHIEHKLNPYDFDWKPLNFCDSSKNDYSVNIKKPLRLADMYDIAAELSKNIDFLRVDFYSIEDKIYVGELTLYPGSGFIRFNPKEVDLKYGKLLQLTKGR